MQRKGFNRSTLPINELKVEPLEPRLQAIHIPLHTKVTGERLTKQHRESGQVLYPYPFYPLMLIDLRAEPTWLLCQEAMDGI
jgi:hypothetical protein